MNGQIPLYLGIPLAALFIAIVVAIIMLVYVTWKDRK